MKEKDIYEKLKAAFKSFGNRNILVKYDLTRHEDIFGGVPDFSVAFIYKRKHYSGWIECKRTNQDALVKLRQEQFAFMLSKHAAGDKCFVLTKTSNGYYFIHFSEYIMGTPDEADFEPFRYLTGTTIEKGIIKPWSRY